jgi:hypothetical protein
LNSNTSPGKKAIIWESMGWAKIVKEIQSDWILNEDYVIDEDGVIY